MVDHHRGTRRRAFKEGTRRLILDAAYALFVEKGYADTTMRLLAQRAGVGLGTIFKHFPDKQSILAAAFQDDLGRVVSDAFATLPPQGLKAQLLHLTARIFGFYARNPELSRILVREALFLTEGRAAEEMDEQLDGFMQAVVGIVAQAQAVGETHTSRSAMDDALAFGSFYIGALIQGLKRPAFDVEAQLGLVARLLDAHFPTPQGTKEES